MCTFPLYLFAFGIHGNLSQWEGNVLGRLDSDILRVGNPARMAQGTRNLDPTIYSSST